MKFECKTQYDLADFIALIDFLRSENGCPWDRVQTHESIRRNLLEEACELAETIDQGDTDHMEEELGDVLFQVVFHAQIEAEKGTFDFSDVASDAAKKMIVRHPFVFGEDTAEDAEDALRQWDQVKMTLKAQTTQAEVLRSVTPAMPALMRAEKVLKKAEKAGAPGSGEDSRKQAQDAWEAFAGGEGNEEQLGRLLLAVTDLARRRGLHAEDALASAVNRYIDGFEEAAYPGEKRK